VETVARGPRSGGPPHVDAPADLVVRGGTIVTQHEATPRVDAIAARDGVVIAIGKEALD
jgi:predicted amidohydrolase YtcJ